MNQKIILAMAFGLLGTSAFATPTVNRDSALAMQGGRAMSLREAVMSAHSFTTGSRPGERAQRNPQTESCELCPGAAPRHGETGDLPLN
ncbi:hypothetical protein [Paraburkholderia youngii]|uniref:hypothetical protein n=1 Tax=Paraburkholderia youngii TaxID=2782701 RepID=UPI003D1C9A0C